MSIDLDEDNYILDEEIRVFLFCYSLRGDLSYPISIAKTIEEYFFYWERKYWYVPLFIVFEVPKPDSWAHWSLNIWVYNLYSVISFSLVKTLMCTF